MSAPSEPLRKVPLPETIDTHLILLYLILNLPAVFPFFVQVSFRDEVSPHRRLQAVCPLATDLGKRLVMPHPRYRECMGIPSCAMRETHALPRSFREARASLRHTAQGVHSPSGARRLPPHLPRLRALPLLPVPLFSSDPDSWISSCSSSFRVALLLTITRTYTK